MKDREINIITTEIVDEVLNLLKNDVYKIVLYGSYARGDFTSESDIDIIVILNCDKEKTAQYRKDIHKIASRVGLRNDIEVSLRLRDKETFIKGKNVLSFYKNVEREGIQLYGIQ